MINKKKNSKTLDKLSMTNFDKSRETDKGKTPLTNELSSKEVNLRQIASSKGSLKPDNEIPINLSQECSSSDFPLLTNRFSPLQTSMTQSFKQTLNSNSPLTNISTKLVTPSLFIDQTPPTEYSYKPFEEQLLTIEPELLSKNPDISILTKLLKLSSQKTSCISLTIS